MNNQTRRDRQYDVVQAQRIIANTIETDVLEINNLIVDTLTATTLNATTINSVDINATGTITAPLVETDAITIFNAPVNPTDGTNKMYVDASAAGGMNWKLSCYAATTSPLTATYLNGVLGVGATLTNSGALAAFSIDSVSPPISSRVLIKDQASSLQNGIYDLTTVGSGAIAWVLTRSADYNTAGEIEAGTITVILNGTTNSNTGWIEIQPVNVVGTDPVQFVQIIYAPAAFFQISNNLSEGVASTKRTNLGIGTGDSPTFTGLTLSSLPVKSIVRANASGQLVGTALTNGQLLIGSTGSDPVAASITGTVNQVTVTPGAGSLTLSLPQDISTTSTPTFTSVNLTGALPVSSGGTGLTTVAQGDIIYGDTGNAYALLTGNTTTTINYLSQTGSGILAGAPVWKTPTQLKTDIALNNVENTALSTWAGSTNITTLGTVATGTWNATIISVAKGGTGLSSYQVGDILYASGATTLSKLSGNTTTTKNFLSGTGTGAAATAPVWDTVTKTDVGLSNVENTALSTWTGSTNITTLGTVGTGTWSGSTIDPTKGGTGLTTYTQGDLIYASAANILSKLSGNVSLTVNYLSQIGNGSSVLTTAWKTPTQIKTDLSLNNVENTALSTWAGSTNLTTLGTVTSGTWSANAISTVRGGTGLSIASAAAGSLLVGNGSGFNSTTLTGTSNQVVVTNGPGAVITLSTPQSIATSSSPSFVNLSLTGTENYPNADGDKILLLGTTNRAKIVHSTVYEVGHYSGDTASASSGKYAWYSVNGAGAFTERMNLSNTGTLTLAAGLKLTNSTVGYVSSTFDYYDAASQTSAAAINNTNSSGMTIKQNRIGIFVYISWDTVNWTFMSSTATGCNGIINTRYRPLSTVYLPYRMKNAGTDSISTLTIDTSGNITWGSGTSGGGVWTPTTSTYSIYGGCVTYQIA